MKYLFGLCDFILEHLLISIFLVLRFKGIKFVFSLNTYKVYCIQSSKNNIL